MGFRIWKESRRIRAVARRGCDVYVLVVRTLVDPISPLIELLVKAKIAISPIVSELFDASCAASQMSLRILVIHTLQNRNFDCCSYSSLIPRLV